MTFVKRMEVQGFKSFANKLVVDMPHGFNAFVGANGSGKSNVIDALCFVLGKTSKKSMRADMLTDLIFNGGNGGRASKFAEVALVFDNSSKIFPYEGDDFRISRRVLSKGTSVFKINNNVVKRQEIINALSGANINPDGFNIILQGDIQKFVDLSSEERRQIIEDISGISIYEDKKSKSLRELEKVEEKLKEARVKLAERERYLKEIINDKKQAEKFVKLQEELTDKKACLLFRKINDLELDRTDFDSKIDVNNKLLAESESKISDLRNDIESLNENLNKIKSDLALKGDSEQQRLSTRIDSVKSKKLALENVIANHTRELTRIKQRRESVNSELKSNESTIKEVKRSIKELDLKIKDLHSKIDEQKSYYGIDDESRVSGLKEEMLSVEEELSRLNSELLISEQSREYLTELEEASSKLSVHESNLSKINKSLSINESKRSELYSKKQEVFDYLHHLTSLRAKLDAKKNVFIDYGHKGVREVIKANIHGVHGTIASLGLTDKRFTTALNVAAGSRVNAVVTTDDLSAQKCIEYLRSNQLGTASFVPLNKVVSFTISDDVKKLKKIQGVIDFAINLIKFDDKYRRAFELVLRDTLVVHDLNTARSVGFDKTRMVTLDGDLVETTGLMTGGYRGKVSTGFMSDDVDDELKEVEVKSVKYEKYSKEINDALSIIEEDVIKNREEKARLTSLIVELQEKITKLKPRTDKVGDIDNIKLSINKLTDKKNKIKVELSNTANESVIKQAKSELSLLETECNNLVIERGTKQAELDKVLMKEGGRFTEIITGLDNEFIAFKQELESAKSELQLITKELSELKAEEAKFYKELKELYDARDSISKKIESDNKQISDLDRKNYSAKEKNQELSIKRASIVAKLDGLRVAFEEFKDWAPRLVKKDVRDIEDDINKLEVTIRNFGPVNMKSIETYKEVEQEFDKIKSKTDELSGEKEEIMGVISDIELRKKNAFVDSFNVVKQNFERIFAQLSPGGIAKLLLENKDEPLLGGVTAIVRPKGKKILTLKSMSGGEKTLTALAFIFAIQECSPTPFYVMDEVDAALDKVNTEKLAEMIAGYSKKSQFIVVSHNDELISASNYLYGVSMDNRGVSSIISIQLPE